MRRIVLSISLVFLGFIGGCQDAKPEAEPLQSTEINYDSLQPDLYLTDGGVMVPYSEAVSTETGNTWDETIPAEPVRLGAGMRSTHVVVKGDTLYGLARLYYGDASRWKDIYDANRGVLPDPNQLRVGRELVIP